MVSDRMPACAETLPVGGYACCNHSTTGRFPWTSTFCDVCGYIYDPEVGDPDGGIAPGTAFEDIPDDWVCPVCGVGKDDFSLYEG